MNDAVKLIMEQPDNLSGKSAFCPAAPGRRRLGWVRIRAIQICFLVIFRQIRDCLARMLAIWFPPALRSIPVKPDHLNWIIAGGTDGKIRFAAPAFFAIFLALPRRCLIILPANRVNMGHSGLHLKNIHTITPRKSSRIVVSNQFPPIRR